MVNRRVVLSIWLPSACIALSRGLMLPVLPFFALSFEAGYSLVGVVLAAEGLGNLLLNVPAGMATSRFGQKRTMMVGGLGMAAMSAAMFQARSLVELLAYGLLAGAFMALWNIARHTYMTDVVPVAQRGRIYSTFGGIGRITSFVGPALGGLAADALGLRVPFLLVALLRLSGVAAAALWVQERPGPRSSLSAAQVLRGQAHVLRAHWRVLVSAGSGQLCGQMVRSARTAVIPLYAAEVLGLETAAVGLMLSLSYGLDMLMFVPAGQIMDRHGRKYAYVPSFLLQSAAMAMIPLTGTFWALALTTMAMGVANGLGSGTMLTLGADLSPDRGRGEFLGLWRFVGDSGSAAGPMVVGRVAEVADLHTAPLVIAAVGVLGAVLLAALVPETLRRKPA